MKKVKKIENEYSLFSSSVEDITRGEIQKGQLSFYGGSGVGGGG